MVSAYDVIKLQIATRHPQASWPPDHSTEADLSARPMEKWGKTEWRAYAQFLLVEGDRLSVRLYEALELCGRLRSKQASSGTSKRVQLKVDERGVRRVSAGRPKEWSEPRLILLASLVDHFKATNPRMSDLSACEHILKSPEYWGRAFIDEDGPLKKETLLKRLPQARKTRDLNVMLRAK